MNVNVDEWSVYVSIKGISGDVPNKSDLEEIRDSNPVSLAEFADLLYLDGDYTYMCEDSTKNNPQVMVGVYAFTGDEESTRVGEIWLDLGVDAVQDVIDYIENR